MRIYPVEGAKRSKSRSRVIINFSLRSAAHCHCLFLADPPEIELETDRVHSGDNKEAHLTCLIHGNPAPKVRQHL